MQIGFMRVSSRLVLVCLTILCGGCRKQTPREPVSLNPTAGEVRLRSGRIVDYAIHFDRNALRDSIRHEDGLIALTTSGVLLRFALPAVRLVRDQIASEEVVCIGRGEGESILAGLADGRICRVDPPTLSLTELVKLPAPPQWIGWGNAERNRPAGLVALTQQTEPVERDGERSDARFWSVHDLATGRSFKLEDEATTILLDRAGRLWLGADKGEWGGCVTRIDLSKGMVTTIKPPPASKPGEHTGWNGVYGFVELRDGQVWAYGGMSHLGMSSGEIIRVDGADTRKLARFEPPQDQQQKPDPNRPGMPITHVAEEDGALLVFSYSDVFRADKVLKSWEKVATLSIRYRWDRRDAVGAYPSVRVVHSPSREGGPYLLATIRDGYVALDGRKSTSHAISGQLGAPYVVSIENTSEGTLFSPNDDRLPVWRLRARRWETMSLAPSFEPDPANQLAEFEKTQRTWYQTQVLMGTGGTIYTVSAAANSPGTRTTARRADGNSVRLGRETSSMDPSSSFITADGTLWNAFFTELRRFQNGRWETVEKLSEGKCPIGSIRVLNSNGPPWLLLHQYGKDLWRLDHGAKGENCRLTRFNLPGETTLVIHDAIPWSNDTMLLATDAGLRLYDPPAHKLSRLDIADPPHPATRIIRDGLGRLWLGSDKGLWLSEAGAKTLEAFDRVPWVNRSAVDALAPDPEHSDGIIAAIRSRGVVFVRARQEP